MCASQSKAKQAIAWLALEEPEMEVHISLDLPNTDWLVLHKLEVDDKLLRLTAGKRQTWGGVEPTEIVCDLDAITAVKRTESDVSRISKILGEKRNKMEDVDLPF